VTEGPYWIDNKLTRRDVREGKPGTPLLLELTIVNAKTCKPIRNADVEIWHADAAGEYSGFDGGSGGGAGPRPAISAATSARTRSARRAS
jgi:protocatechuate 3,4-dioxygenase beta subunit